MARLNPITSRDQVAPDKRPFYDELMAKRGRLDGPPAYHMNSPQYAVYASALTGYVRNEGLLSPGRVRLAAMMTGRWYDAQYIWAVNKPHTPVTGPSDATIAIIGARGDVSGIPGEEGVEARFVDELLRNHWIADATFDAAAAVFNTAQLLEITGVMSGYTNIAYLVDPFAIEPPPDTPRLPEQTQPVAPPKPKPAGLKQRLQPVTAREQMPERDRHFYDEIVNRRGSLSGPTTFFLNAPQYAVHYARFTDYTRMEGLLTPGQVRLVALMVARQQDCDYIWAVNRPQAPQTGPSEAAAAVIGSRGDVNRLTGDELVLARFVDELQREHRVSDATYDAANTLLGTEALLQFTGVISAYTMIAYMVNAFNVEPPPNTPRLP